MTSKDARDLSEPDLQGEIMFGLSFVTAVASVWRASLCLIRSRRDLERLDIDVTFVILFLCPRKG